MSDFLVSLPPGYFLRPRTWQGGHWTVTETRLDWWVEEDPGRNLRKTEEEEEEEEG